MHNQEICLHQKSVILYSATAIMRPPCITADPILLGVQIYTKRQHQCSINAAMTLATQLLVATMETNSVAPECGCNTFWSDSIVVHGRCVTSVITT